MEYVDGHVKMTREEYERLLDAIEEVISIAREAARQRDMLLRKLKRLERRLRAERGGEA